MRRDWEMTEGQADDGLQEKDKISLLDGRRRRWESHTEGSVPLVRLYS